MKELFAAFAAEIFRPIVTILIPGLWGASPSLVALFLAQPVSWHFVLQYRTPSALVLVAFSTALGLVFENLGGRIENAFFKLPSDTHDQRLERWYDYLALTTEPRYIAFSYIGSIVLRLRFESSMSIASSVALVGIAFMPVIWCLKLLLLLGVGVLARYFVFETRSSVRELDDTREALLTRIRGGANATN